MFLKQSLSNLQKYKSFPRNISNYGKIMQMTFSKTDKEFQDYILECISKNEFVRIQFYDEINAFFTEQTLLKDWDPNSEILTLQNDTQVAFKKIIRINETAGKGYDQEYFKCDC